MLRLARSFAMFLALSAAAHAVQPSEVLPDPALERRAREISSGLRCLVCQNQSIDDSDAPLAKDLRLLVRQRLTQGESDEQVRAFVVARYGDFVLLKPPFDVRTLALWATPFLILAFALAWLGRRVRRMAAPAGASRPLSEQERERIAKLSRGEGS